ncbi:uncharacterized protein LOC106086659 [Stomoxys calcitrans]|uniref:uncharacterized protein LOC106086659 n=1 Tax=Stomoxys calcitrans TaxID=35570 RepID=UPI0027E35214|nr:uncharacterized protein LOC106086659 [Stomoxys calcitrans]
MLPRNVANNNDFNNMLPNHYIPILLMALSFCQGSLLPPQTDLKHAEEPGSNASQVGGVVDANGTVDAAAAAPVAVVAAGDNASEARGSMDGNLNLLPRPANLLLDAIPSVASAQGSPMNLTREHEGDIFWTNGVTLCNVDTCVGLSSGSASWLSMGVNKLGSLAESGSSVGKSHLELLARQTHKLNIKSSPPSPLSPASSSPSLLAMPALTTTNANGESCQCRCLPYLKTYREDLGICVDDIHECSLSPFVSGSSSEKIPYVFLPLRGQIIYPSREIRFTDIRTPVCAVTGAQYLTINGWSDLRNPIDNDYPFRMFRDEGRTFLQWLGEADLRHKMQGRLIVVHLVCRDMTLPLNMSASSNDHIMPPKNVFSPCVAFRVNGSPVKFANNVSEVLFQSEATATLASTSDGMSTKEYIVIGVCSLLLGLIYVSSVFLYLHMKKRKGRDQPRMRNSLDDLTNEINYPKNDQVTFGAPFTRSGSLYSVGSLATTNEPRSRASLSSLKEEMGIVKNNPLLQHFPQLSDHHSGFTSDISNSASECEMDGGYHDKMKQMQTNALIHPQMGMMSNSDSPKGSQHSSSNGNSNSNNSTNEEMAEQGSNTQENECLPQENVAIIEDMMTEEKLENLRAMVNGNVRKKLYFNPAYFEPHLLAQPPPAAVEFLQKIREVIAIAKYKMASKRYQPSLNVIPEENQARSDTPSLFGSNQIQNPAECQGCVQNRCSGHVKNCGDKRNTIEKWLETVNLNEDTHNANQAGKNQRECETPSPDKGQQSPKGSTSSSSQGSTKAPPANTSSSRRIATRKDIAPPKQKPPPPPTQKSQGSSQGEGKNHSATNSDSLKGGSPQAREEMGDENAQGAFQNYEKPSQPKNSLNIPILHHKLEAYSAISASAFMYGYAETGGEIYNNPKFTLHDSPAVSRSSSQRSKTSRKRLDVLDQYAAASTPTSLTSTERQHYHMLRNIDHANENLDPDAIVKDYSATLRSNSSFQVDIPTPDYDSTMEKKIKDIYNNTQSSAPSVPTPDYSSLSRRSLKQYQPDSPIYRRKSPQYLIVDYETDSLERVEGTKRKSSQSSSSPSSDVSSQLSPSLSTALPLEEELEISHTVYGREGGGSGGGAGGFNSKSLGNNSKKLVRSLEVNMQQKDMAARIKYDTPFRGSMTIEVEHEPPSDLERSTDSDQYEPDTLDRKPKKQSFCDVSAWSSVTDIKRATDNVNSPPQSLPDMNHHQHHHQRPPAAMLDLAGKSSFRLKATSECSLRKNNRDSAYESQVELRRPCGNHHHRNEEEEAATKSNVNNLREIYQSLLVRQNSDCSCKCGGQATSLYLQEQLEDLTEKGRILTLEAKHTRRQRPSEPPTPPPLVEISNDTPNKCTIKISTPKSSRENLAAPERRPTEYVEPRLHQRPTKQNGEQAMAAMKGSPSPKPPRSHSGTPTGQRKFRGNSASPLPPPPAPPTTSASTTLNSKTSRSSSQPRQYCINQSATEEDTLSNHSECTEVTGISGTMTNSEFDGSMRKNTLASLGKAEKDIEPVLELESRIQIELQTSATNEAMHAAAKKLKGDDYGAIFNTHIKGLRNDYSLNKYLNRRKSQEKIEFPADLANQNSNSPIESPVLETNNNLKNSPADAMDPNKLDVISLSSRSNRSSSRLSDRTKEMYRNAGVPVGIAYPQRSSANANTPASTTATPTATQAGTNVQTVYRCEIEPVQLTHGMQIAMGLKDRPKKAKDIKNAWRKFVSMAASKFSPTQSPAPPYDKKATSSILEVLERDEGISSLIEEKPRVSSPKSTYSAPASQNYYEQRFGPRPLQEMDSGYMSADSGEALKRSFYDRYNFKMMSGRDHIIRVDTIQDNSDNESTSTDQQRVAQESRRFEDFEHINEQQQELGNSLELGEEEDEDDDSDNDSDKTITRSHAPEQSLRSSSSTNTYTTDEDEEEEDHRTTSYGSSETDGDTNNDDLWESGAESIETHSVLYRNIRKSLER